MKYIFLSLLIISTVLLLAQDNLMPNFLTDKKIRGVSYIQPTGPATPIVTMVSSTSDSLDVAEVLPEVVPDEFLPWVYPSSEQLSFDGKTHILKSADQVNVITGWYEEKMKIEKLTTTSFIKTSNNGKILNKLVGVNGDQKIMVEISKEFSDLQTIIEIEKEQQ